jgi:omega-6 fatty acid desaturase (delta-12 desaturase)
VLQDHPELRNVGRLTLLESFRCVRLVLWDETERRLISFREARASC